MSDNEKLTRHERNPFIESGKNIVTTKKKRITVGRGENILLDSDGVERGTQVHAFHEVDDAQFIKLFTQNITAMLGLTAAGNKAFVFLSWSLQRFSVGKDLVPLGKYELEDFVTHNESLKFSEITMRRGIRELEEAKIVAKAMKPGVYYINPNFIFNGDRVRFVTEIRRKSASKHAMLEEQGQTRLVD